ncbi:MAG: hypothetical protein P8188_18835 [Gemmatimonadota bacterium]
MNTRLFAVLLLALFLNAPTSLTAQAGQDFEIPAEFMDALRKDVRQLRTQAMQSAVILQPGQATTFWPIYDEYQAELEDITQARAELVRDYAVQFATMSDDEAVELGHRAMELREERASLVRRYFDRIASEVSGTTAGQFYQVEQQVQLLLDLKLASELPLIGE